MESVNDIYLVAGATGRTGIHITRALVEKGKTVRILVRSLDNVNKFFKDIQDKFESIVICDILLDNYKEKLEEAFKEKNGKSVRYVISTLSYRFEKTITCKDGNFTTNERLINFAKNRNIKKFVMLSSTHLKRPFSLVTLRINITKNNMQWWKVQAEKCLRESGMNYLIIRPVGLLIDFPKELPPTDFTLSQGDTVEGKIHRSTVGKLVADTMLDEKVLDNSTYECITYDDQFLKPYNYVKGSYQLRADNEEDKRIINHMIPKRIILSMIYSSATLLAVGAMLLGKYTFKNKDEIIKFIKNLFKKQTI